MPIMNYLSHLVSRGDTGSSLAFGKPPNAPRNSLTTPSTLEGLRRVKKEGLGAVPSNPSILVCIAWSSMVAAYASMVATVDVPTTIDTLDVMVTQGMCCIQQAYGSALHCCGLHQSSGHCTLNWCWCACISGSTTWLNCYICAAVKPVGQQQFSNLQSFCLAGLKLTAEQT